MFLPTEKERAAGRHAERLENAYDDIESLVKQKNTHIRRRCFMSKVFCLLNHSLTKKQIEELRNRFCANEIIYPSENLSARWSQIPTSEELDISTVKNVIEWLTIAEEGDFFIVQGEYGLTFILVDYALQHKLIPLYAVTKRMASERVEGEKVSRQYVFEHVCFRKYCNSDILEEQ